MSSQISVLLVLTAILTLTCADPIFCGNKYCGIDAVCNDETKKCECPLAQPLGDPVFRCHSDETISCVLVGDPSLQGYSGSLTFLDFPCKYTLSKFDAPLLTRAHNNDPPGSWNVADPGRDRCRIIIQGTNTVSSKGSYFLETVDISISFNIGGSNKLESLLVSISGKRATYSYAPYPEVAVEKDSAQDCLPRVMDNTNGIGLTLCYSQEYQIWSFGVAVCGSTFVNFRAWQGLTENQHFRPGVSITANENSVLFNNKESEYPNTMCGSPFTHSDDIYHEQNKKLGIIGKRNGALHSFLVNNPPAQPHYCVTSIELYNLCSADKKVAAINKCGPIVTQLAKCVIKNEKEVLKIFEACVAAVCLNPVECSAVAGNIHHGDDDDCNNFVNPC